MLQYRSNVKRAQLELTTAKTKLQNLLGRKTDIDEFDIVTELKAPLQSAEDLIALQKAALESRPDVQAMQMTQARSQSDLKLQLAQGKVDYTYGMEYRRQQGVNGRGNSLGFFFSVPIPLYNRNQGEISRAQITQEQLNRQVQALKAQINTEVRTSFDEFIAARDLVESIERDLLKPAEQARDTVAYVYKTGDSSLIEFLDAQRAFNDTMQSYYEAQAAYRRAVLQMNAVIGKEIFQ